MYMSGAGNSQKLMVPMNHAGHEVDCAMVWQFKGYHGGSFEVQSADRRTGSKSRGRSKAQPFQKRIRSKSASKGDVACASI